MGSSHDNMYYHLLLAGRMKIMLSSLTDNKWQCIKALKTKKIPSSTRKANKLMFREQRVKPCIMSLHSSSDLTHSQLQLAGLNTGS